jgi:hypothetical protein
VFLANEKQSASPPKKNVGVQPFITANKTKLKAKVNTLREKRIVHEAIKI